MRLILGSTSSARIHLLKQLGVSFETLAPLFDERSVPFSGDPIQYVQTLALKKNESLSPIKAHGTIITCDTIVYHKGAVFNKPLSYQDAFSMLESLSGQIHYVYTAVCISKNKQTLLDHAQTEVEFNLLNCAQIEKFLEDPAFLNRAGAYTISGFGALLVKKINGSYDNVIGLPLNTIETLLNRLDESLWD